jgi:hypothetical protein
MNSYELASENEDHLNISSRLKNRSKSGKGGFAIGLAIAAVASIVVISAIVLGLIPVYLSNYPINF